MGKEVWKDNNKYLFLAMIAVLFILSYFILKSFAVPLISAFVLAYLVKPIYDRLEKKFGKTISASICVLIVLVVVLIALSTLVGSIVQQVSIALDSDILEKVFNKISSYSAFKSLDFNSVRNRGLSFVVQILTPVFSGIPFLIITLIVMVLGVYYILVNWDFLVAKLKGYIPFKEKDRVAKDISKVTNTVVYGFLLFALIEFVVAAFGFYLSGVQLYFSFAVLIFLFAFIPGLGPAVVWVPAALYYLFFARNYFAFSGVLITGVILSVLIDMIFRGKIIGDKVKINPLIMIVGVLGGISVFGVFGFIIGPLILVYTIEILHEGLREY